MCAFAYSSCALCGSLVDEPTSGRVGAFFLRLRQVGGAVSERLFYCPCRCKRATAVVALFGSLESQRRRAGTAMRFLYLPRVFLDQAAAVVLVAGALGKCWPCLPAHPHELTQANWCRKAGRAPRLMPSGWRCCTIMLLTASRSQPVGGGGGGPTIRSQSGRDPHDSRVLDCWC